MLDLPVPDPGPPGPFATMPWLRATVSRFANGETHARRRAHVEARLATLDPAALAAAAREAAADAPPAAAAEPATSTPPTATAARRTAVAAASATGTPPAGAQPTAIAVPPATGTPPAATAAQSAAVAVSPATGTPAVRRFAGLARAYLPVAVLADATGVVDPVAAVGHTRIVAAAYHPGTEHPGADDALAALLALLPTDEPEGLAQHVALLVQACEATAGLVRGDDLPVKTTKRVTADGEVVAVDLTGRPFGEGPRRCPGEAHARALAEALR